MVTFFILLFGSQAKGLPGSLSNRALAVVEALEGKVRYCWLEAMCFHYFVLHSFVLKCTRLT